MYLFKAYKDGVLLGEKEANSIDEVREEFPTLNQVKKRKKPVTLVRVDSDCKDGVCPNKVTKAPKKKKTVKKKKA